TSFRSRGEIPLRQRAAAVRLLQRRAAALRWDVDDLLHRAAGGVGRRGADRQLRDLHSTGCIRMRVFVVAMILAAACGDEAPRPAVRTPIAVEYVRGDSLAIHEQPRDDAPVIARY